MPIISAPQTSVYPRTVIVVPPFASLDRPALGAHLLQAAARQAGFSVDVIYANLHFAKTIGVAAYQSIYYAPTVSLLGERVFARSAYNVPPLGGGFASDSFESFLRDSEPWRAIVDSRLKPQMESLTLPIVEASGDYLRHLRDVEEAANVWTTEFADLILRLKPDVVGSSTTFEQTASSIAILQRVKSGNPLIVTILGGANCEGEMGEGLASLGLGIDHVFSGESEVTFPQFLQDLRNMSQPVERVIAGKPCHNLDALPLPDFQEYFQQRDEYLPGLENSIGDTWLPFETSRGCWWGQKHHCTFCGLNGEGMAFREKTPARVLADLQTMADQYTTRQLFMVDNIMPHNYFRALLPKLPVGSPPFEIFYEQKSNLSLADAVSLRKAGVLYVQPGIEALSTKLLRRMDKGVTAAQNIRLLRSGRAAGLDFRWGMLWGFPGDEVEAYQETLALLPFLRHLQPPSSIFHLSIDRFSPYFDRPAAYEIKNLRPYQSYFDVLPPGADVAKIAYHFTGNYGGASHEHLDLVREIAESVAAWKSAWNRGQADPPALNITKFGKYYIVIDTRGIPDTEESFVVGEEEAVAILSPAECTDPSLIQWAVDKKLLAIVDLRAEPLATGTPALLAQFDRSALRRSRPVEVESENQPLFQVVR